MFSFGDQDIKKKFNIVFILFIVIPIIILSYIGYRRSYQVIKEKTYQYTMQVTEQATKNIDAMLKNTANLINVISQDQDVKKVIEKDYSKLKNPFYEMITDERKIEYKLQTLKETNEYISNILLYNQGSKFIYNAQRVTGNLNVNYRPYEEKWYKKLINKKGRVIFTSLHRNKQYRDKNWVISVGKEIMTGNSYGSQETVVINISFQQLREILGKINLSKSSKVYLVDNHGNIIYSDQEKDLMKEATQVIGKQINNQELGQLKFQTKDYLFTVNKSDFLGWKIVTLTPKKEIFSELIGVRNLLLIITTALLLSSLIASFFISKTIIKPVQKLQKFVEELDERNLNERLSGFYNDEIGKLKNSFNKMLNRINNLISKIKEEKRREKELEMEALQAQINPHFLYNTLNGIKWLANVQNDENIVNAIESLIRLLKFSAQKGKDFITIEEQIEYLKKYIYIQKLRYINKFRINIDLDDNILECESLKFILQPLVENAIFHNIEEQKGQVEIEVQIRQKKDKIIYMVKDDGSGIPVEMVDDLFSGDYLESTKEQYNKIGLRNVNERIKYFFGPQYGLDIDTTVSQGTKIIMTIPVNKEGVNDEECVNNRG